MTTVSAVELKAIAPYSDAGLSPALQRLFAHPALRVIANEFFPGAPFDLLYEKARGLKTIEEFQAQFIDPLLKTVEKRSTCGVTISGVEGLGKDRYFLYISNHRDIILDSALFTDLLFRNGLRTPQICLGDNLLNSPFIVDLVKINKGITVKRGLPPRELLHWSYVLSKWIRKCISERNDSVWIAQHEGRCKDGNDVTHSGVIKMLSLSSDDSFIDSLLSLHIVPVAVSYEYDPNDVEKSLEIYLRKKQGVYHKGDSEDQTAMIRGLQEPKGGIHIQVGEEIKEVLVKAKSCVNKAEQVKYITNALSSLIQQQYRNWPSNYIAYDLLNDSQTFTAKYSPEKKGEFVERLTKRLDQQPIAAVDREAVKAQVLSMYAMSVVNQV